MNAMTFAQSISKRKGRLRPFPLPVLVRSFAGLKWWPRWVVPAATVGGAASTWPRTSGRR